MSSILKTAPERVALDHTGYLLAIFGAILFSSKGIFVKLAYAEQMSPEVLLALRMAVAVPVYLVILAVILWRDSSQRDLIGRLPVWRIALVGVLGYFAASLFDFWGLVFVTAQYERLVLFTYPFFVFVLGVVFFGDRMNWRQVPGMLLGYCGILILFAWNLVVQPEGLVAGTLLVLVSALLFAVFQFLAKREMMLAGSRLFTCIGMVAAGLAALIYAGFAAGPMWIGQISPRGWALGLAIGIIGTVLPSFMLNSAINRIGPRTVSAMGNFGPLTTIFLAVLVLGEAFTIYHAAGAGCVMAGAIWFSRGARSVIP